MGKNILQSQAPVDGVSNEARLLDRLMHDMHMDEGPFAELLGTDASTVQRIKRGEERPSEGLRDRLWKLEDFFRELQRLANTSRWPQWIEETNEDLLGQKPGDLIRQGRFDLLMHMLHRCGGGGPR